MITYAWIGLILIILIIYVRWKTRGQTIKVEHNAPDEGSSRFRSPQESPLPQLATSPVTTPNGASNLDQHIVVHRICPHNKVIQGFEVEQKDSLDGHLDLLTRKLAEKSPLAITEPRDSLDNLLNKIKSKVADKVNHIADSQLKMEEVKLKMDTLNEIGREVRGNYNQLIKSMKNDLSNNEHECLRLQQQLYWLCKKRMEIGNEVHNTQAILESATKDLNREMKSFPIPYP